MGGKLYLGEFEHIVMAAALRLEGEAYGARILQEIEDATGTRVKSGSLYITLDRLEAKGYVTSRVADPDPGRGGRPKRYMSVTPAGLRILKEARNVMLTMWRGLESRLEKAR